MKTNTVHDALTTVSERHADAMASSAVKERPILMGAAMVRACLDGTKSQTRRVVKPTPQESHSTSYAQDGSVTERLSFGWSWRYHPNAMSLSCPSAHMLQLCPYGQPGDRLWVRETFFESNEYDEKADAFVTYYRATDAGFFEPDHVAGWHWRPSIFMPRRLSRLTLAITAIRIERVQDITEADALAEGVASVAAYRELWNHLNAKRGYGWDVNPFVWVVSFVRVQP